MAVYPASITFLRFKKATGFKRWHFWRFSSEEDCWVDIFFNVRDGRGWQCDRLKMLLWDSDEVLGSFKICSWNPKWQQTNSWCGVHHAGRAKQRMAWKLLIKHILNQIANTKTKRNTHIYIIIIIYLYTHTMCMCRPTYETQQKVETIESRRKACWTCFFHFSSLTLKCSVPVYHHYIPPVCSQNQEA